MSEKNYILIALDESRSQVLKICSFGSKELTENFGSICNLYNQFLTEMFVEIQNVPLEFGMIDPQFREYSDWPEYIVMEENIWKNFTSNPEFVFPPQ